ncbi:MAG: exosortase E/protease, VPEID-CTERM system, partial [Planctomycetes bacterium]|nr:exosortase E/protease, VPEID-CTERM system [Planctomycetota bacterium]
EVLFGRRFLRKELMIIGLASAVIFQAHVRNHRDAYRSAAIAIPRLLGQAAAFLALFGFLITVRGGGIRPLIGEFNAAILITVLTLGWLASWRLLLPAGVDVRSTVLGAMLAAALVAVGMAITDSFTDTFWNLTGGPTVNAVEFLLGPFAGAPVIRPEPMAIGIEGFTVKVNGGCSGYQGIGLIILLFSGYLWWFRRLHRFPQSFLLFPLGIGLIFLSNIVRITALILVGIWISPEIAVDGFHSQAGWVAFLVVGLGIIAAASRMPFFTLPVEDEHATGGVPGSTAATAAAVRAASATAPTYGPTVAACLFPFLAMLASTILTELFAEKGTLSKGYPLRVIAIAAVLWNLRHEFRWREATLSPVAVALGGLTCVMWMLLAPSDPETAASLDPAQLGLGWGSAWLLMRFIGYMILVPIAEELAFRGFLARRLMSEDAEQVPIGSFTWVSFLGSSLAFGLFHGVQLWFPATLAGVAFAAALYHRRKLVDAIVAHATTNALLGFYAVFTGAWDLG